MRSPILISIAASVAALQVPVALARQHDRPAPPPLDYRMESSRDDDVTYQGEPADRHDQDYMGKPHGPDPAIRKSEYQGQAPNRTVTRSAPSTDLPPETEYGGFYYRIPPGGRIEGGFYYPPPVVTTTVTEYRRTEQ